MSLTCPRRQEGIPGLGDTMVFRPFTVPRQKNDAAVMFDPRRQDHQKAESRRRLVSPLADLNTRPDSG
jgi:hypothetical protein